MALLDRFRKTAAKTDAAKKPAAKKVAAKKSDEAKADVAPANVAMTPGRLLAYRLLRQPHVSEKAARLAEKNAYVFDVPTDAEKVSIKKAVEAFYNVKVVAVRTIQHEGKKFYRGRRVGTRRAWKKAIVSLAPGQKINLYEGV
jgi:large subunit ribosomal protein L23